MKKRNKITDLSNVKHFELDTKVGLTEGQVADRIANGLVNKTEKHVTKSYLMIIYENVINFFNLLLFAISAVMIVAKIKISSFAFLGVLLANIAIGLYQDIRARKLIDKLKVVSSVKVDVLRNGKIHPIPANELVYSDIVQLRTGNQIVCDGSIVDGVVEVNESLLTGESVHISKQPGDIVYSGSFVTSGHALYRIEQLGKENYAEKLQSKAKKFKKVKSEILKSIKGIFRIIGVLLTIFMIAWVIIKRHDLTWPGFANMEGSQFQETIEKISGSLVAMIPIGMYLLTSITLAVGVIRLAGKNMLTQDMYCIETLARVDTLCLDKTGTLTDGTLRVRELITTSRTSQRDLAKMISTLVEATKDDNATARAIKNKYQNLNKFDSFSAVPFSSDRKFSAVMLEDGRSIVMGAREFIPHNNPEVDEKCKEYELQALRVLVIGQQTRVVRGDEPLGESEILGLLVLEDHIRDDANENIQWFKENGVDIRIITGDNHISAAQVAKRAGIEGWENSISLEGMSLEEVRHIARDYKIFGRVSPEQKETIIEALQDDGHSVAMTGDGVNDILALRVADCSIAMASGSDAAKNVSHLVSLDSNFSALPDVVKEGRRVINNLQRSVSSFLVKTVFAMILTAVFLVWGLFDSSVIYPFKTNNMYLWEMLNIGVGSLFLSLQPNDEQIKSKFIVNILVKVLPAAIVQCLLVIAMFCLKLDTETATCISVVLFNIFSFVILFRICMPFDIYRIFLIIGIGFVESVAFLADYFALGDNSILGITYSILNGRNLWIIAITFVIAIVVYVIFEIVAAKLQNVFDKKKEAMKYDRF